MTEFQQQLRNRILVLDGAMGTMIQRARLAENDYRGERFADHPTPLYGNNDILCLTRPDIIENNHRQYLEAGSDIISTNSFNANPISQTDYSTEAFVEEINLAAAQLARKVADDFMNKYPERKIFVAGSVGPTNRSASISPKVDDPAFRNVDFDELLSAYRSQISALADGGVDIILFETVFDTLNLKAGLEAARQIAVERGHELPVMVSATIAGPSGRILSGQTLSALLASVSSYENIVSFGLNCSWGAKEMLPYVEELSTLTDRAVSCHPNAGLPDADGNYAEPLEEFTSALEKLITKGQLNIVGGCCGTTPRHIAAVAKIAANHTPRTAPSIAPKLQLVGFETLDVTPENNFINVGERCNVAGSRKFLRLIKEKSYGEALAIARKQVEDGAQIIDINMDDSMIDTLTEMIHFLRLIASDPDVARVPVMIDSSDWSVLEAGLKCVQGKCVVNSISLKEGEDDFLRKARKVRDFGASVVVMAFDEKGQADTYERKIEICERAYRLLTEQAGFSPENIIFDPNIMAVATGIEEHDLYACDYIRAVKWIKENLPGAKVSGGVSNLSFAFRGHNRLREAMHALFLYHAIAAGLDMAIVNPASAVTFEDVEPELRNILDRLFLDGNHEAAQSLSDYADRAIDNAPAADTSPQEIDRTRIPVSDRLRDALIKGNDEHLADDIAEALTIFNRAIDIIDGPLMEGVSRVGALFGEGKMFLPQVVKTARVMKQAVDLLKPSIEAEKTASAGSSAGIILFATVKGDVHDIGKNIVSIVLECNNYKVIDLGVMVPAETIVESAIQNKPDIICLSGLITPSLAEMANVADKLEAAGLKIPLIVGGATTSKVHTALKLAHRLSAPVVHASDAAQNPLIAARLLNPDTRQQFVAELNEEYAAIKAEHAKPAYKLLSLQDARNLRFSTDWNKYIPCNPRVSEIVVQTDIPLATVIPFINWRMFFHFWKLTGDYIDDFPFDCCPHCINSWKVRHANNPKVNEALKLYNDALAMLTEIGNSDTGVIRAVSGIFPAYSDNNDNVIIAGVKFPMLRRQTPNSDNQCLSLSDFVLPEKYTGDGKKDYVGAFVVTASSPALLSRFEASGDNYSILLLRSLLDRLAEAGSEYLHQYVRTAQWAYTPNENLSVKELFAGKYRGIRPAMGYPMTPDQTLNLQLAELLPFDKIGVTLTENGAMNPPSTVSGLYIAHPDARYFMIGQIGNDQIEDYATRRNLPLDRIENLLSKNI